MEKTEKKLKINLGCGLDYKESTKNVRWINVDNKSMFPDAKVDNYDDIRNLSLSYENRVDEILISHVVMYLRPEELQQLLTRCYICLVEGGMIEIETINFDQVMDYAKQNDKSYGLDCIFGTEITQTHRWGWNITRLRDIIIRNGFKNLKIEDGSKNPRRDFKIIATK